jgi:hypothetical protein
MRGFKGMIVAAAIVVGCTAAACNSGDVAGAGSEGREKVSRGGMIWADGELFRTIGTPATFSPGQGNFDELYNTGGNGTFADGVMAISESKPGDADYNGGRWHVNLLNEDVDPEKYADATSVEDLDLSDFHSTDTWFECPLLRQPGGGN